MKRDGKWSSGIIHVRCMFGRKTKFSTKRLEIQYTTSVGTKLCSYPDAMTVTMKIPRVVCNQSCRCEGDIEDSK